MMKSFYTRFVLFVTLALAATAVKAGSTIYIDIPELTPDDRNTRITVPVKASFDQPVTTWDVQFQYPEGLTPVAYYPGSNLEFGCYNYSPRYGEQPYTFQASLSSNNEMTHFVGSTMGMFTRLYDEEGNFNPTDPLCWKGSCDELFFIDFMVSDYFMGGTIEVKIKTTWGHGNSQVIPSPTIDYTVIESDVNSDGNVSISDYTALMQIIVNLEDGNYGGGMPYRLGDINHDGSIDILDAEMLVDYISTGTWYVGQQLTEGTSHIEVVMHEPAIIDATFYINDFEVSSDDLSSTITIPVKASFDHHISAWDVEFEFPEGLTPVEITPGRDMNLSYVNHHGEEVTERAVYVFNDDLTHIVANNMSALSYTPGEDGEEGYYNSVKWNPGEYGEMFLITLRVEESFQGGYIITHSKATCGWDARFPSELWPITIQVEDEMPWPGDVNGDGQDNVNDIICMLEYLAGVLEAGNYFFPMAGDVNRDGLIDLRDMQMVLDYIFYDNGWHSGYALSNCDFETNVLYSVPSPIPGDVSGDYNLSVLDVTMMIDILLGGGDLPDNADVNGDGNVSILDVTILIDMLLAGGI